MVGRTPEYLGKKIAAYDMKMVALAILLPPVLTLVSTGIAVSWPGIRSSLTNMGPMVSQKFCMGFHQWVIITARRLLGSMAISRWSTWLARC